MTYLARIDRYLRRFGATLTTKRVWASTSDLKFEESSISACGETT
jgi:hypothetical protein